jgi:formylglycine-generating enzyme required for sulfatase activity
MTETGSRVLRGGSFYSYGRVARCAYRYSNLPYNRNDFYGFRVGVSPGL